MTGVRHLAGRLGWGAWIGLGAALVAAPVFAAVAAHGIAGRPAPAVPARSAPPGALGTWGSGGRVYFVSPKVGWSMTQTARDSHPLASLYHTVDGGATWTKQLEWQGVDPMSVTFTSPTQAVVVARVQNEVRRVFSTADGLKWRAFDAPSQSGSVAFLSPSEGWAAYRNEGRLVIEHTVDGGRSWRALPSAAAPSAVDPYLWTRFLDGRDGMVAVAGVGAGAAVYVTHDGGTTWSLARLPAPPGATPQFRVVASGAQSAGGPRVFVSVDVYAHESDSVARHYLYYSADAGRTWSGPRPLPGTRWQALDDARMFTASSTVLYRSGSGGRSWSVQGASMPPAPPASEGVSFGPYTFAGVEFLDDRHGWATAESVQECAGPSARPACREHPLRSSTAVTTADGGVTWRAVQPDAAP